MFIGKFIQNGKIHKYTKNHGYLNDLNKTNCGKIDWHHRLTWKKFHNVPVPKITEKTHCKICFKNELDTLLDTSLEKRIDLLESTFKHSFAPQKNNDRFCKYCDLYITDNVHETIKK